MGTSDDILEYFRRELSYLRVQGADFARRNPKVAQRLSLSGAESPDPHVERLIEAVAFLGARIHRDLDREFPQIPVALLDNLCPSLTQPIPSITIAQMTLDPSQGKVTSGMTVARGAMLQATGSNGEVCRFKVAWDMTLWPLTVSSVQHIDSRTLRIEFTGDPGTDLAELEMDRLRLHLSGELMTTMPLHELLISGLESLQLEAGGSLVPLGRASLAECGFDEDQDVIPRSGHAHPAYGLLQEYFIFPRKFQFFELRGLRGRLGTGSSFAIRLVFDRNARVLADVGVDNFKLGCTPIINLFSMTSEPIVVDHLHHEYPLVADRQRDAETEIHSIVSVISSDPKAQRPTVIRSLYEAEDDRIAVADVYWTARRETTIRKDLSGTDMFVSFVDRFDPRDAPGESVVYAELLCTNRRLAEQLPSGARMLGVGLSGSLRIKTLYDPSAQRDPVLGSEALWSLVALMRLNHQSLVDGTTGVQSLREMLLLFAGESAREHAQVRGVKSLSARPATAQIGDQTWRGYCRGTEVALEFDLESFAGGSPLLMAAVLARFFALYTTINSFVRLRVERNGEIWHEWPAMSGRQWVI